MSVYAQGEYCGWKEKEVICQELALSGRLGVVVVFVLLLHVHRWDFRFNLFCDADAWLEVTSGIAEFI